MKCRPLLLLLRAFGYNFSYWHPQSRGHGGLHGVALLSRVEPEVVKCGWIHSNTVDLDGRVLTCVFPGFVIVQTYVPCSTWPEKKIEPEKSRARDDGRRTFDLELRRHLIAVQLQYKREVIWTGDQNVTLNPEDVWDGITNPRRHLYPGCKPWEIQACKDTLQAMNFIDSYRHFHPQPSSDDHTQHQDAADWSMRRGQRLDYLFCTERCLQEDKSRTYIKNVWVDQHTRGSDHQPVFATIVSRISVHIPEFLHVPPLFNGLQRPSDIKSTSSNRPPCHRHAPEKGAPKTDDIQSTSSNRPPCHRHAPDKGAPKTDDIQSTSSNRPPCHRHAPDKGRSRRAEVDITIHKLQPASMSQTCNGRKQGQEQEHDHDNQESDCQLPYARHIIETCRYTPGNRVPPPATSGGQHKHARHPTTHVRSV